MQLIKCRKRTWVFCLHLTKNIGISHIIADDDIRKLLSAQTGSNCVEYEFAMKSVPCARQKRRLVNKCVMKNK